MRPLALMACQPALARSKVPLLPRAREMGHDRSGGWCDGERASRVEQRGLRFGQPNIVTLSAGATAMYIAIGIFGGLALSAQIQGAHLGRGDGLN